jgi:histidinol dehydrogenase
MEVINYPSKESYHAICERPSMERAELEGNVREILDRIKTEGDQALIDFALKFDNQLLDTFEIDLIEAKHIAESLDSKVKAAIDQAYLNIKKFHEPQFKKEETAIETMPGVLCWRKSVGIEKVGIYIPGGSAPLFSTVLMLAIPAQIAGCKEIVLCSPSMHPAIYYSALKAGVHRIFRIGGAQAIGALAYGTHQVPKVYKIFGPGNQFVTIAKQLVSAEGVAIDMPAGPSEVAVYADHRAHAAFVAADLLSQAEHGADSQVLLVSTSEKLIQATQHELKIQLETLSRKEIAEKALENSKAVIINSEQDAKDILNLYAAEHLILACENPEDFAYDIYNAGSIFLGDYTPESCGDYASGTNHTLPTNAHARAYSGVSVDSFVKKITHQKISREGLENLGDTVEIMAEAEGLLAHKNAVRIRRA